MNHNKGTKEHPMEGSFMKSNSFQAPNLWLAQVPNVEDMSIQTKKIVPWNVESMVAHNVPQEEKWRGKQVSTT
jgi:hypothetical protein